MHLYNLTMSQRLSLICLYVYIYIFTYIYTTQSIIADLYLETESTIKINK